MEDLNVLAADCVVISCCCQCLILQIAIFVFLKLPYKLARRTGKFAAKKLRKRRKGDKKAERERGERETGCEYIDHEFVGVNGKSMRIEKDVMLCVDSSLGNGMCMKEVENVLEELYEKGEFGFGSFWRSRDKCDDSVVQYHLIEVISYS